MFRLSARGPTGVVRRGRPARRSAPPAVALTLLAIIGATCLAPAAARAQAGATTTTSTAAAPPPSGASPPTTVPPPPPPDPRPILTQVDADLAQLTAIDDYKPAQALVAAAQQKAAAARAAQHTAERTLQRAEVDRYLAAREKQSADDELTAMAIAAYVGVGYTSPGLNEPAKGNGTAGPGTVSTPGGLTGVEALDSREMLTLVTEHALHDDTRAKGVLVAAGRTVSESLAGYQRTQSGVATADSRLAAARRTLQLVTAAATNRSVAASSVTALPDLGASGPHTGTGTTTTTTPRAEPASHSLTAADSPSTPDGTGPPSPQIMGASKMTGAELAAWFASTGRKTDTTVTVAELARDYQTSGEQLGVRYDVAFAQSVVETGYFSFPAGGQLTAADNNFAGIGACDSCAHGRSFPNAATGVQAQIELLYMYSSGGRLPAGIKDVVGSTVVGGCCPTWMALSGTWASNLHYGISIMTVYHRMLTWVIPQRMATAGLPTAGPPTAGPPTAGPPTAGPPTAGVPTAGVDG